MPEIAGLSGTASAEEDQRLVPSGRQHSVVTRLGHRVDVRRHVLAFAALKKRHHLKNASIALLESESKWFVWKLTISVGSLT